MDRVWLTRLRWRMRGAWLWPCFALATLVEGVVLHRLPFYGEGPGTLVGAFLVAGFANLFAVAAIAPLVARRVRRRRRDLPKAIAENYTGTALIALGFVLALAGGLIHRPAVAAERDDQAAAVARTHDLVASEAPSEYRTRLAAMDVMRLDEDYYRSCVPGPDPRRWFCLFVNTAQRPAGAKLDTEQVPNAVYRRHGGFR